MSVPDYCPSCTIKHVGGAKPWELSIKIDPDADPALTFTAPVVQLTDSSSTTRSYPLDTPSNPIEWTAGNVHIESYEFAGSDDPLTSASITVTARHTNGTETEETSTLSIL